MDFKKVYDSIDLEYVFQILKEQGLDIKTLSIVEETSTDTKSKVNFMSRLKLKLV